MITTKGKQREYLNERSLCCSIVILKIGDHKRSDLTSDPRFLHQAVDNLEAISEQDQLTNTSAGHHQQNLERREP